MLELIFLALALAMDAFAIAVGLGAKHRRAVLKTALMTAIYFGALQGIMPLLGYGFGQSVLGVVADFAPWIAGAILVALGAKMLYDVYRGDDEQSEDTEANSAESSEGKSAEKNDEEGDIATDPLVTIPASAVVEQSTSSPELRKSRLAHGRVPHNAALDMANDATMTLTHKTMLTLAVAGSLDALAAGFTLNVLSVNAYVACALIAVVTALLSFVGVFLGHKSGTWLESRAEIFGGVVLILIGIKMVVWMG